MNDVNFDDATTRTEIYIRNAHGALTYVTLTALTYVTRYGTRITVKCEDPDRGRGG